MDLSKSYEFFKPEKDQSRIHIVGCGSVGSTVAENLARCGVTKMTLWDFDTVEPHNLANQMFREKDVGKLKVEATCEDGAELLFGGFGFAGRWLRSDGCRVLLCGRTLLCALATTDKQGSGEYEKEYFEHGRAWMGLLESACAFS